MEEIGECTLDGEALDLLNILLAKVTNPKLLDLRDALEAPDGVHITFDFR